MNVLLHVTFKPINFTTHSWIHIYSYFYVTQILSYFGSLEEYKKI
jgi:hypothetical protein